MFVEAFDGIYFAESSILVQIRHSPVLTLKATQKSQIGIQVLRPIFLPARYNATKSSSSP